MKTWGCDARGPDIIADSQSSAQAAVARPLLYRAHDEPYRDHALR